MSLTRRAMFLASLAAALGVIDVWGGDLAGFPAWKIALVLLLAGLLYEWVFVSGGWPTVRLPDDTSLKLGEKSQIDLVFFNPASRCVDVEYVAALPHGLVSSGRTRTVSVSAESELIDPISVRAVVLDTTNWKQVPARVSGPLGLARWSRNLPLAAEIGVQPDTLKSSTRSSTSASHGSVSKTLIGGGMELHHLRPYRKGDARSAIDWKATARSGGLVTRVFGEDQHLEIVLAIDAGRTSRIEIDGMSQLSHYVNLAARFAEYAVVAEDRAGLVVFSDSILQAVPPRRGLQGVRQVRAGLQNLTPQPVESNLIDASLRIRALARQRSLVVLMTDLYDRGEHSQLAQCVRMLLPTHLPIIVGIQSDEISELADGTAKAWFDPYKSLAAREYQTSVDSNLARLRRMGAFAVTARPRDLDDRVFSVYDTLRSKRLI